MEHRSLLRLFGICTAVGGFFIALFQIWFYLDSVSFVATYFDHVGWAFITFGFIGFFLVQYRQTGGLGFFSYLMVSLGLFQWLGYKWFLTFVAPDLRRSVPEIMDSGLQSALYGVDFSNYFLMTSFFLFAVISLFTGVLSRLGLSLLLIGSAIAFNAQLEEVILYSPLIPQAMIGLAFVWLGYSLVQIAHKENTYEEIEEENTEQEKRVSYPDYDSMIERYSIFVVQDSSDNVEEKSFQSEETPLTEEKRQAVRAT